MTSTRQSHHIACIIHLCLFPVISVIILSLVCKVRRKKRRWSKTQGLQRLIHSDKGPWSSQPQCIEWRNASTIFVASSSRIKLSGLLGRFVCSTRTDMTVVHWTVANQNLSISNKIPPMPGHFAKPISLSFYIPVSIKHYFSAIFLLDFALDLWVD